MKVTTYSPDEVQVLEPAVKRRVCEWERTERTG